MNLQDHMDMHALDAHALATKAQRGNMRVDEGVISRALAGLPIAAIKAQIICDALNKEYDIPISTKGPARGQLTPESLGIQVYHPGEDNGTGDGNAIRSRRK